MNTNEKNSGFLFYNKNRYNSRNRQETELPLGPEKTSSCIRPHHHNGNDKETLIRIRYLAKRMINISFSVSLSLYVTRDEYLDKSVPSFFCAKVPLPLCLLPPAHCCGFVNESAISHLLSRRHFSVVNHDDRKYGINLGLRQQISPLISSP